MVDIPKLVLNTGLQFLRSPAGPIDWKQVAQTLQTSATLKGGPTKRNDASADL